MSSKKQKEVPAVYKPIANGIAPPKEMIELQKKAQAGVPLSSFETKRMQIYNYIGAILNHAEAMRLWQMKHLKYVTILAGDATRASATPPTDRHDRPRNCD